MAFSPMTATISGSQVIMHGVRMFRQLMRTFVMVSILVTLGGACWTGWYAWKSNPQQVKAAMMYASAHYFKILISDEKQFTFTHSDGRPGSVSAGQIRALPAFKASWIAVRGRLFDGALWGLYSAGGVIFVLIIMFYLRGMDLRASKRLRGADITSPKLLNALTKKSFRGVKRTVPRFRIAGVTWPFGAETHHTKIVGTTGSGKTVAMLDLLDQIRATRGKAIIYDKMGSFIPYFYREGRDIILNPLDKRSRHWDLFCEVRHEQDFDMIASALIPQFKDTPDPFWTTAARQLFSSGAAAMWKTGKWDLHQLIDMLLKTSLKELAVLVEGMVEQALVSPENDRMATSVRAIMTTSLKPLIYMPPVTNPFSIRDWVEDEDDSFLFLSSDAMTHERRKALIATQLEVATASTLSGAKDTQKRIWFIIDELPTLEQIPSLTSGLRESRQFGGAFVLGTQVDSELREIYGREAAESISGNCNTRLQLRTPDMATAEAGANSLGRSQTSRMNKSYSFGASEVRDGVGIVQREEVANVVLAGEIMELQPLEGYLRVGGGYPITKIELKPKNRPKIAEHFVLAPPVDYQTGEVYDLAARRNSNWASSDNTADQQADANTVLSSASLSPSKRNNAREKNTAQKNSAREKSNLDAGRGDGAEMPLFEDGWGNKRPSGPPASHDNAPPPPNPNDTAVTPTAEDVVPAAPVLPAVPMGQKQGKAHIKNKAAQVKGKRTSSVSKGQAKRHRMSKIAQDFQAPLDTDTVPPSGKDEQIQQNKDNKPQSDTNSFEKTGGR